MGIKEFRERIGEIADGDTVIELTKRGRVVGEYRPKRPFDHEAAKRALESVTRWQAEMRAQGIEPEDWLAEMRLDSWGAPLDEDA
ncbi:MAG: hypothetical protein ABIT04_01360 [Novosphingobium sp.]